MPVWHLSMCVASVTILIKRENNIVLFTNSETISFPKKAQIIKQLPIGFRKTQNQQLRMIVNVKCHSKKS